MRYKLLVVFLLVNLSACSFQANIITPPPTSTIPPEPSATLAFPSDIPPLPTFTPIPTSTFTQVAPPTALQENVSGAYSIRFAPGGTYADIVDSLSAGTSKTYSINALKGQVMSISIHQSLDGDWTVIPMKIVGANGQTLCPPQENRECYFWRGVLPSTQDYLVTLTPETDVVNFTMRVAIDPPGTTTQEFQYLSASGDTSFSYTDEFAPTRFPGLQLYKVEPDVALEMIDSQLYENTNLIEAYYLFGSTDENDIVESCTQPISFGGTENIVGEVNVNGKQFVRSEGGGVGAGNIYEQIYHRTVINGYCYEITFFFHYANIGNYSPDAGIKEFDHTALMQKFESILSTLVIK